MNIQSSSIDLNQFYSDLQKVEQQLSQLETIEKGELVTYNEGKLSPIGGDLVRTVRSTSPPLSEAMQKVVNLFQTSKLSDFTNAFKKNIDDAMKDALKIANTTNDRKEFEDIKQKVEAVKARLNSDKVQNAFAAIIQSDQATAKDIDTIQSSLVTALSEIDLIQSRITDLEKLKEQDTIANWISLKNPQGKTRLEVLTYNASHNGSTQAYDVLTYQEFKFIQQLLRKKPESLTPIEKKFLEGFEAPSTSKERTIYQQLKSKKPESLTPTENKFLEGVKTAEIKLVAGFKTALEGYGDAYGKFIKRVKDFQTQHPQFKQPEIKKLIDAANELRSINSKMAALKIEESRASPTTTSGETRATTSKSTQEEINKEIKELESKRNAIVNEHFTKENIQMIADAKNLMRKLVSEEGEGSWLDVWSFMDDPDLKGFKEIEAISAIQHKKVDEVINEQIWEEHKQNQPKDKPQGSLKTVIEGAGPHGLLAGMELFLAGANVTVVNDRGERYVRNQLVDLDPKWAMGLRYLLGTKFDEMFVEEHAMGRYNEAGHYLSINTKNLEDVLKERSFELASFVHSKNRQEVKENFCKSKNITVDQLEKALETKLSSVASEFTKFASNYQNTSTYDLLYEAAFKEAHHPPNSSSYVAVLSPPSRASPDAKRFNAVLVDIRTTEILERDYMKKEGLPTYYDTTDEVYDLLDDEEKSILPATPKTKQKLVGKKTDEILESLMSKYPEAAFSTTEPPMVKGQPVLTSDNKPISIREYAEKEIAGKKKTVLQVAQDKAKQELIGEKAEDILESFLSQYPEVEFSFTEPPMVKGKPVLTFDGKPVSIRQYAELEMKGEAPHLRKTPSVECDFLVCCGGVNDSIRDLYLGPARVETIPKSYGIGVLTKGDKFRDTSFLPKEPEARRSVSLEDLKPHLEKQNFKEILQTKLKKEIDGKEQETAEFLLPEDMRKRYENLTAMMVQGLVVDKPKSDKAASEGKPPVYQKGSDGKFILNPPDSKEAKGNKIQTRMFENKLTLYAGAETPPALAEFVNELNDLKAREKDKDKANQYAALKKAIDQKWITALCYKFIQQVYSKDHPNEWETIINPKRPDPKTGASNLDYNKLNFDLNEINAAVTFPVDQKTADTAALELQDGEASLIVTALGDARASPHFFTGSGMSTGRLGIQNTAILVRDFHQGNPIKKAGEGGPALPTKADLVEQLDKRLDEAKIQTLAKGGHYVSPSPKEISNQQRHKKTCDMVNATCQAISKAKELGDRIEYEIMRTADVSPKNPSFGIKLSDQTIVLAQVTNKGNIKLGEEKEYFSLRQATSALQRREKTCQNVNSTCQIITENGGINKFGYELVREKDVSLQNPDFKIKLSEDKVVPAQVTDKGNIKSGDKEYPSLNKAVEELKQENKS